MRLRSFPSFEEWKARNLGEMFEICAARKYPEVDMHMRRLDQWVKWCWACDAMQPAVRIAAEAIRRARG